MIKLHVFKGFENRRLGITSDTELGHLYDDQNDQVALIQAVNSIMNWPTNGYLQGMGTLIHYDLWGIPLAEAKKLFKVVDRRELAEDIKRLRKT